MTKEDRMWISIIGLLFLIIIFLTMKLTKQHDQINKYENNIEALCDSLTTITLKNGDLLYEKQAYLLEIKELEDRLGISRSETKELERKLKSSLSTIAQLRGTIHVDTVICYDSIYIKDDISYVKFSYKDEWLGVSGLTQFDGTSSQTKMTDITMQVPLKFGFTENNQVYATSPNPYLNITTLEGAIIQNRSSKPKHWCIGFQLGMGGGYNLLSLIPDSKIYPIFVGPYLGVGISYGFTF